MKTVIKIFLVSILAGISYAQVTMGVSVSDGVESTSLTFGVHPSATDGIDAALGEAELPPVPPGFYARFVGGGLGQGSATDLRYGLMDGIYSHSYTVSFKNDQGPTITFSWSAAPGVTGTVQDALGGIVINETLEGGGSVVIDNPLAINSIVITANYNYLAAPSGLGASETTLGQVDLTWTDNSSVENGYILERKEGAGGIYSQIADLTANSTSYSDNSVSASTTYYYRVKSYNNDNQSAYSETNITTQDPPFVAAPTGLGVTAPEFGKVSLSWTDNADNEDDYIIERKVSGGVFAVIATIASNSSSYDDLTVAKETDYTYRVKASNAIIASDYSNEASVTSLGPPAISDPSGLSATAPEFGKVSLSWNDNADNEDEYIVERKFSGGSYSVIATIAVNSTTYDDLTVAMETAYTYRVKASNSLTTSGYSNESSVTSLGPPPISAPSGLGASSPEVGKISLVWSDNSDNEDNFVLERKVNGGSYSTLSTLTSNTTSYNDLTVSEGVTYFYRVKATNALTSSNFSNEASVQAAFDPISAPTGLTATGNVAGSISMSWTDNSDNETGYRVERQASGGSFIIIDYLGADANSYSDNSVAENTNYSYRVIAYNSITQSAYSNTISVTSVFLPITAPSGLTANSPDVGQINIFWSDNSNNETGFVIQRKTSSNPIYSDYASVSANVTSYTDNNILELTTYTYRVKGVNNNTESSYSGEAGYTTGNYTIINSPTALSASAFSGYIGLGWTDNSNNEQNFILERQTGSSGNYIVLANLNANQNSYNDFSISEGEDYSYRVKASNQFASSGYSNIVSVTAAFEDVVAPGSLALISNEVGEIVVGWNDNSSNEIGFRVERKDSTAGYKVIATLGSNVTSYTDNNVIENIEYSYRLEAYSSNVNSGYSNTLTVIAKIAPLFAPGSLTVSATTPGELSLSWVDNSANESGFIIERKSGSEEFSPIFVTGINETFYLDAGLAENVEYQYRLRAVNKFTLSDYSNIAGATTLAAPLEAPSGLAASVDDGVAITLKWSDNSNNEKGYRIEKKKASDAIFTNRIEVGQNVTQYKDTDIEESTVYIYRVCSYNDNVQSVYTPQIQVNSGFVKYPPNLLMPDSLVMNNNETYKINVWDFVDDPHTPDSLLLYEITGADNKLVWDYNPSNGNLSVSSFNGYAGEAFLNIIVTNEYSLSTSGSLLIKIIDLTSVDVPISEIPETFNLYQNYPNPFNPSTNIQYYLVEEAEVELEVLNILGEKVIDLKDETQAKGMYSVKINAKDWPGGVYFYSVKINAVNSNLRYNKVRKMILIK